MLIDFVIEAYEVFSRKIHKIPQFVFEPSQRELKQIENFIALLEKKYDKNSIGRIFLFNFMALSYDHYSTLDHQAKKRIPLNWIVGKKALDRWVKRVEDDLYHSQKYVAENGIHIGLIGAGTERRSDDVTSIKKHEEEEKLRFYNKPRGMVNCIETTTLYNHRSLNCISCIYRKECKNMLKINYPKLYIARGYLKI